MPASFQGDPAKWWFSFWIPLKTNQNRFILVGEGRKPQTLHASSPLIPCHGAGAKHCGSLPAPLEGLGGWVFLAPVDRHPHNPENGFKRTHPEEQFPESLHFKGLPPQVHKFLFGRVARFHVGQALSPNAQNPLTLRSRGLCGLYYPVKAGWRVQVHLAFGWQEETKKTPPVLGSE